MRPLSLAGLVLVLAGCMPAEPTEESPPTERVDAPVPADAPDAAPPPGDSQAHYTYPGCPDPSDSCPGFAAAYCALDLLRQKHDSTCTQTSDCVLVQLEHDCTGSSACGGVPMHAAGAAAFRAEAQAEVTRYCASAVCSAMPACLPEQVVCRSGRCGLSLDTPDGGP